MPAESATSSSTSWTFRSAPGPPDAVSAATVSVKFSSQREQAVTSASAPVEAASSTRSAAVAAEYSGNASRQAPPAPQHQAASR